jgi:hypothetical protein
LTTNGLVALIAALQLEALSQRKPHHATVSGTIPVVLYWHDAFVPLATKELVQNVVAAHVSFTRPLVLQMTSDQSSPSGSVAFAVNVTFAPSFVGAEGDDASSMPVVVCGGWLRTVSANTALVAVPGVVSGARQTARMPYSPTVSGYTVTVAFAVVLTTEPSSRKDSFIHTTAGTVLETDHTPELLSSRVTFTIALSPSVTPHNAVRLKGVVRPMESADGVSDAVSVPFTIVTLDALTDAPLRPNGSVGVTSQMIRSLESKRGKSKVLRISPARSTNPPVPSSLRYQRYVAVTLCPGSGSLRSGLHERMSLMLGKSGVRLTTAVGAWLTKNGAVMLSRSLHNDSPLHA